MGIVYCVRIRDSMGIVYPVRIRLKYGDFNFPAKIFGLFNFGQTWGFQKIRQKKPINESPKS